MYYQFRVETVRVLIRWLHQKSAGPYLQIFMNKSGFSWTRDPENPPTSGTVNIAQTTHILSELGITVYEKCKDPAARPHVSGIGINENH